MTGIIVAAVVSALLTSLGWKWYLDRRKDTSAYQEGWTNGYDVCLEYAKEQYKKGYEEGVAAGKGRRVVARKAKKITPKGD